MISVVTPTYNRAYVLSELWESLKQQTCSNFEWLIVDDGSQDNTEELVASWQQECPRFVLSYFKKENGGKHRALNFAIPQAKGDYIFIVDSDDRLAPDAVESVYQWIETLPQNEKFAGVAGLRCYPDGKIIGSFPKNKPFADAKYSDKDRFHLRGDKAEVYRKDLLLEHPFPEFEGENYIGEGYVWNVFSQNGYLVRWYNKPIYVGNYLTDGLTKNCNDLQLKNFNGYTLNTQMAFKAVCFPYNYVSVAAYISAAKQKGMSAAQIREAIDMNRINYCICSLIRILKGM